jgi:heptosyltransferase-1
MWMPMKDILIVRLSAIGDVVMTSAILPPLRRKWPEARIHWLTEDMGGEVLAGCTELASLIVIPRRRWKKLLSEHHYLQFWHEVRAVRRKLKDLHPDLALDAQGLLRSALWTWMSGAKRRVGLRSHEGAQFLMSEVVKAEGNPTGRMCNEYRALTEYLAPDDAGPFSMCVAPTAEALASAKAAIPDGAPAPVFLFPFTTRPQKHWFNDRWAQLAGRIANECSREVWILGGPSDEEAAKAIAEASGAGNAVHVVAGKSSNIADKMGLLSRAGAAVGVDTGLSHMALALGTPTVVLFGSTCGYTDTAPLPGIILYEKMPCSPCHRHPTCGTDFTCMRRIGVDSVFKALTSHLGASKA